jgi:hypothetical protein
MVVVEEQRVTFDRVFANASTVRERREPVEIEHGAGG